MLSRQILVLTLTVAKYSGNVMGKAGFRGNLQNSSLGIQPEGSPYPASGLSFWGNISHLFGTCLPDPMVGGGGRGLFFHLKQKYWKLHEMHRSTFKNIPVQGGGGFSARCQMKREI